MSGTVLSSAAMQRLKMLGLGEDVFRIMIVGEMGLGKSTLVSCLLEALQRGARLEVEEEGAKESGQWKGLQELPGGASSQSLRRYRYVIEGTELGYDLKTVYEIIDTPGFASKINNSNSWLSKLKVIKEGMLKYCNRGACSKDDPRVHLCIYVLAPVPRPLKDLDKRVMLELQRWVPVIPVIAKADTFTAEDLEAFQCMVRKEFRAIGLIPLTDLGEPTVSDTPAGIVRGSKAYRDSTARTPLAIITSNKSYRPSSNAETGWEACDHALEGARFGRLYRWGLASCEESSDLAVLRKIINDSRHFIMQRCDECTRNWEAERDAWITCMASTFAQIEAYQAALTLWTKKYNECTCSACLPPKPEFEAFLGRMASAQHHSDAKVQWLKLFEASFESGAAQAAEAEMHVSVESQAAEKVDEQLVRIHVARAKAEASGATFAGPFAKSFNADQLLREALRKAARSGTVKRLITSYVAGVLAQATGIPEEVSKPLLQGAADTVMGR